MSDTVFDDDVLLSLSLPWQLICRLAVMERCTGTPLSNLIEQAIAEKLDKDPK